MNTYSTLEDTSNIKGHLIKLLTSLPGMIEVEKLICEKFASEVALLEEIPTYLFGIGGKRVRPALALIVGSMFGTSTTDNKLVTIAAGIELIHLASLLHDDIIDRSQKRRHQESALAKYGLGGSLLAGDFLFVRAFGLCSQLDRRVIEATEMACVKLTEGEILEISTTSVPSVGDAMRIAKLKTSALFSLACECGAYLSNCSAQIVEEMKLFGEELGTAFQITDDILDISSTVELLGKELGSDLKLKKPSVVNSLWVEHGTKLSHRFASEPAGWLEGDQNLLIECIKEIEELEVTKQASEQILVLVGWARARLSRLKLASNTLNYQRLSELELFLDLLVSRDS